MSELSTFVNKIVKKWSKVVAFYFFLFYNSIISQERGETMLIGSYRHSLDAKNRFRVPTKLKNELGSNFIITKGTGGCLFAFSSEGFEELYKKVAMLPLCD